MAELVEKTVMGRAGVSPTRNFPLNSGLTARATDSESD